MNYNKGDLDFIQDQIIHYTKAALTAKGLEAFPVYSDLAAWKSHARLAGWSIDGRDGKMFKQHGNIRTYYKTGE